MASRRACPLTSRPAAVTCSACCSRRTPPAAVTYGGVWRALDIYVCERGGGVRVFGTYSVLNKLYRLLASQ